MASRRRSLNTILPLILLVFLVVLVTVHCSFIPLIAGSRHRTRIDAAGVFSASTTTATAESRSRPSIDCGADILSQFNLILEMRRVGLLQPGRNKTSSTVLVATSSI